MTLLPSMFQEKQLVSLKADAEREMFKLLQYSHATILKQKQKTELFSARRKERISESIANHVAENYYQKNVKSMIPKLTKGKSTVRV
jgi:hypothetical protein